MQQILVTILALIIIGLIAGAAIFVTIPQDNVNLLQSIVTGLFAFITGGTIGGVVGYNMAKKNDAH